ncbi:MULTISPECIES: type-F conjugative transfer system pilin assembly protein TrbC [spotted fever group]|uniref:Type-F conjugative transfer system pilin assembly protein TrbC n=1 Tax=Rickettsia tamurae subsp. buchneri TaxID=1462938 RepID=A0A8E0WKC3_9RICK|nr:MULTISPECIES: type-F conjugative transfer system pilin assembly protein TrbC [spotted fever group]EER20766.1 putative type-F conjugative transfer system pilin assembly protein TrbC [Rickettsia endosymbiont of Ixodes scapularis]KDO02129.1 type-F conjugative transfer system pilin assembly protein TrbC [Rickettsia tamurae subsp. buchneri]
MEKKELLRKLILIILSVFSTTSLGSFFVVSEKDIEFAEKIQAQVQKIVNKGLKEKYQEYEQISKNTAAAKNDKTLDVADTYAFLNDDNTRLRIFVSSSMSLNLLRSYYKEAQRYGGHLVFNGLPKGSFKELLKLAQEIVEGNDIGGLEIDDEAFSSFNAQHVPMIVLSKEVDSLFDVAGDVTQYDSIQGAVSIKYALEEFATRGDMSKEAKQRLERCE